MGNWIYKHNNDNSSRYLLGQIGNRNLICVGINPSTATPEKLDATVTRVKEISKRNGYDGWLMLNVYPQRDTYPKNIHNEGEMNLIKENCEAINSILTEMGNCDIWAAWGTEINRRPYLIDCLEELTNCFSPNYNWLNYGSLTKFGHPKHPSRMGYSEKFRQFNINQYLESLKNN